MMNSLGLSPLPTLRTDDESTSFLMEKEGFVDEAVVAAMVAAPHHISRSQPIHADLALSSDDLDFAGWSFPAASPARQPVVAPRHEATSPARRPEPPVICEPGLGASHQGNHRWWIAGLAGILSTMLFSVLLLSLSYRPGAAANAVTPPDAIVKAKAAAPVDPRTPEITPELTDISPVHH